MARFWWGRRDSNPHGRSHMLLRHARLPFRHSPDVSMVLSGTPCAFASLIPPLNLPLKRGRVIDLPLKRGG